VPLEEYKWAPLLFSKHPIVTSCSHNFSIPTCWSINVDFLAKFEPKLQTCVFFGAFQASSCFFVQVLKDFGVPSKLTNFLCVLLKF